MNRSFRNLLGVAVIAGVLAAVGPGAGPAAAARHRFVNALGMEFVWIPPGTFVMGSPPDEAGRRPDEGQREVTITRGFYIQTTEVTLAQWRSVMGRSFFSRFRGVDDEPVTKASWHDAQRFADKLNRRGGSGRYRLPTEAEWEYAARAGTPTAYPWGDAAVCARAMYGNSERGSGACLAYAAAQGFEEERPAPVRSYPPNAWGLYDMNGNVWEWCEDWYGPYPAGPAVDPRGPGHGTGRVRRGGSWFDPGTEIRSASRAGEHPAIRAPFTGFRLVWAGEAPDKGGFWPGDFETPPDGH